MVLAEDALNKAQDAFEPYENKPADNLVRAAFESETRAGAKSLRCRRSYLQRRHRNHE